ncbi:hypothetical protein BO71DRAFT_428752 [Aspergillus ellipticus CBS 707.79]|uniref:Uncharacterized protein n=1 Tax=Aspergillus ellipticus CBS 707.79 TaxID=1448320 RepID=A0A319DEG7_9EURO|nr:hypothetical protein BO71DRAFT_428752 [Aspergillus ellipticus CBS 707.79]
MDQKTAQKLPALWKQLRSTIYTSGGDYDGFLQRWKAAIEGAKHLDEFATNLYLHQGPLINVSHMYFKFRLYEFKQKPAVLLLESSERAQATEVALRAHRKHPKEKSAPTKADNFERRPKLHSEDLGTIWCRHHGTMGSHLSSQCQLRGGTDPAGKGKAEKGDAHAGMDEDASHH